MFNHFQHQDGVSRSAVAIANHIAERNLAEVTLISIFKDEKAFHEQLYPSVKYKKVLGFYFRGLPHVLNLIPISWINFKVLNEPYDIMIGFQEALSIKCIAASNKNKSAIKFAWQHCFFDWLLPTLRNDYERIGRVVCVSRENAEKLKKELPSVNIDYSYNPIDEKIIQRCGEESINLIKPDNCLLFVSVARMSPEKGYERLLKICRRLLNEGFMFKLWLIGDGPILTDLKKQAAELALEDCVTFMGSQNNPHKFTSKADAFICSSFIEGYSTACTEAIMLGVPVISTSVSGAQEIIDDAECGMVVKMDDESLYEGMKEVLTNPSVIDNWKNQLKLTRERFYAKTRLQRLINILELNTENGGN